MSRSINHILLFIGSLFLLTANKAVFTSINPRPAIEKIDDTLNNIVMHTKALSDTSAIPKITLYLTFDDGPNKGSQNVNDLAIADSVNITVFVIGKFVFKNEDNAAAFQLYQNNPFIEIDNHSFTHANSHHYHSYYAKPEEVKEDFLTNADTLHLKQQIARLPGRNCWRIDKKSWNDLIDGKAAADSLVANGYKVFGWDIEWHTDSAGRIIESADEIYKRINGIAERKESFVANNIIILCHDPMLSDSLNEVEIRKFIQKIKASGKYQFNHLKNYPQ